MIGKVIEGRYEGASINKHPDNNVLFIQTEDGTKVALSKKNTISIDDVTEQYPSAAKKTIMVLWDNFETSIIQLGIVEQPKATQIPHVEKTASNPIPQRVPRNHSHTEEKNPTITVETKAKQNWFPIIIASCIPTIVLSLVFVICLKTGVIQFASQQNTTIEQPISNQQSSAQTSVSQSKPAQQAPKFDTALEYDYLDHTQFSQYWYDGAFKCGADFQPGEYYILPLYTGGDMFSVSNTPNNFPYTNYEDYKLINKYTFTEGQFVKIEHGALMVPAEEVDTENWWKYGAYLVGKDIPAGDYKVEQISDDYNTELSRMMGASGTYQVCEQSPEKKPIVYENLYQSQMYVTLKEGQYLVVVNCKLTPA